MIIEELRREFNSPSIDEVSVTTMEVEAAWGLHAAIFYLGIRQFIYNMAVDDIDKVVQKELTRKFLSTAVAG